MSRRQGERGFTLVETLVGLAILSAVLIASYSAVSGALKTVFLVAEKRAALEKVQQQVDILRRQPPMREQVFGGETKSYRWRVSLEAVQGPNGRRSVVPFRIVGRLISKSRNGRSEIVVDTVVLGQRG
jgi:prepilin-type N-terminal cleavage/methylation domain-containing protein